MALMSEPLAFVVGAAVVWVGVGGACTRLLFESRRLRCVATTLVSTDSAISAGVCAPIGTPAGAMIASMASGAAPALRKLSFKTVAFLALATNQTACVFRARAALSPCRSRRPCVATTTSVGVSTNAASEAGSSLVNTREASGKAVAVVSWAMTVTWSPTRGANWANAFATAESPMMVSYAAGTIGSMNNSNVPPE